jgi:hypothetical protein
VERGVAGALRVVLVRDRRAEEGHDAVAGVLVDRALEAMDPLGEELEEAVHDPVPCLGVELLGEAHRALHVGEEHGHVLALALEGGAGGEDLLGEVIRSVGARLALAGRFWRRAERTAAAVAEPLARRVRASTGCAGALGG